MSWAIVREFLKNIYHPIPALAGILAVWESLKKAITKIATYLPRHAVLGELSQNNIPCMIFVIHLFTPARDNTYEFSLPDYFPPHTTGDVGRRVNIPHVI